MTASTKPKMLWLLWLSLLLKTALKSTAQVKLKLVDSHKPAEMFWEIANTSARTIKPAGPAAFPAKETLKPLLSGNASLITTALIRLKLKQLPTPFPASKRSAPLNTLSAKRIPNASLPFRTATRNAEAHRLAGSSASPAKEAKLPLTLPSAPTLRAAPWPTSPILSWSAWTNPAFLLSWSVSMTEAALNLFTNVLQIGLSMI